MSPRNVAAALIALAVVLLLTLWLAPSGSSGGFAFAQVQGEVEKTKSVQYVETRRDKGSDEGQAGPERITRVMILGRHLKRQETNPVIVGDIPKEGEIPTTFPERLISIYDAKKGRLVTLDPKNKRFVVARGTASISRDDGRIETHEIEPLPEADFYGEMRRVPADQAEKLPERTIDGKKAIGFRVVETTEEKRGTDTWTRTFWVDPETKLPIRIEISFRSTDPMMGGSDWVQSDFIFDAPLDPSLFSTDPPEGYTVVDPGHKPKSLEL